MAAYRNEEQKWLEEQFRLLSVDSEYRTALKAISDLAKPRATNISGQLTFAVIVALTTFDIPRKSLQKVWLRTDKTSWKALADFPRQIERMAGKLKNLNAHPIYAPALFFDGAPICRRFEQLPDVLNLYAKGLLGKSIEPLS